VIDDFVAAEERADVDALVAMTAEDVWFTMPPRPAWFAGVAAVEGFMRQRMLETSWRLRLTTANAQPALACYQRQIDGPSDGPSGYRLGAVNVPGFRDGRVDWIAALLDRAVFARLPEEI
jgi:ketosteroid isomerase-like protein